MTLLSHPNIKCPWCQNPVQYQPSDIPVCMVAGNEFICLDEKCTLSLRNSKGVFIRFRGLCRADTGEIVRYFMRRTINNIHLNFYSSLYHQNNSPQTILSLDKMWLFESTGDYISTMEDIYRVQRFVPYPLSQSTQQAEDMIKKFYNLRVFI